MGAIVLHNSATDLRVLTYLQGFATFLCIAPNPAAARAISAVETTAYLNRGVPLYPAVPLKHPGSLAIDSAYNLYLFDPTIATGAVFEIPTVVPVFETSGARNNTPRVLTPRGVGGDAPGPDIRAIAADGAGNRIIVGKNIAFELPYDSGTGQEYTDSFGGPATGASFTGAAIDGAGDLFLLDQAYNDVIEFPNGNSQAAPVHYLLEVGGTPLANPSGLAVDIAGNLFVSDTGNNRVVKFPAAGGSPIIIAPTVDGVGLNSPSAIVLDGIGDLFISDTANNRVVEVPAADVPPFEIAAVVDGLGLSNPAGLAFDPSGNLYIADPGNARVLQVFRSFLPADLNFSQTSVGVLSADSPQTMQIQNTGGGDPLIIADVLYPPDFPEASTGANPCYAVLTVNSGEICTLNVDFKPQAAGDFQEQIVFDYLLHEDPGAESPFTVGLSGTGATISLSTDSLSYGSQEVGTASASQQVTVTNYLSTPLTLVGFPITGPDASSFVFGSTCLMTLAPGASCIVHGHFTPQAAGPLTATLHVEHHDAGPTQLVTLSGTGLTPPTATLSGTNLSFGSQAVGTSSASQSITLTNTGEAALAISGISTSGPNSSSFIIGYDCPGSLAGGASCTIHGHFSPATTGPLTATIIITNHATGSPQTITLTGTGQ